MKYTLFPGCVSDQSCPELLTSTETVLQTIELDYIKTEGFSCCGASHLDIAGETLNIAVNARNFALANKENATIITPCSTCYVSMKKANNALKESTLQNEMEKILEKHDLQLGDGNEVQHLLEILTEEENLIKITNKIQYPFANIKIAPFYGCHLVRPKEIVDSSGAEKMDLLIVSLGAILIHCSTRFQCCGFHIQLENEDVMLEMAGEFLAEARDRGADIVLTSCPLCHLVFDIYQSKIKKLVGGNLDLPILHLSQLVGLALGAGEKAVGLKRNIISAKKVFSKEIRRGGKA